MPLNSNLFPLCLGFLDFDTAILIPLAGIVPAGGITVAALYFAQPANKKPVAVSDGLK